MRTHYEIEEFAAPAANSNANATAIGAAMGQYSMSRVTYRYHRGANKRRTLLSDHVKHKVMLHACMYTARSGHLQE